MGELRLAGLKFEISGAVFGTGSNDWAATF